MHVAVKMHSSLERYMLSNEKRCHVGSLWTDLDFENNHAFL